jgi:hypothetical protein
MYYLGLKITNINFIWPKGIGGATYCFIELHLLLQVEADDTVVIVDPVTVEVIHLSYNKTSTAISFPQDFKQQHLSSLLGETH